MRLLFRLSLTILFFLVILTAYYLILPSLLANFARNQLTQHGFSGIEIEIGPFGLQSTAVKHLQMSNGELTVRLQGLQADYQLSELLSGTVDSIQVKHVTVLNLPAEAGESLLLDPLLWSGFLTLPWHETMPARSLAVKNLVVYGKDGTLSVTASGEIHKLGQRISGEIRLVGRRNVNFLMSLAVSSEKGVDLQLHAPDEHRENPLSVKLQAADGVAGLTGEIKLDLSRIAELIGVSERLSGLIKADVAYFAGSDASRKKFTISAVGNDVGFAGWQLKAMTADLKGNIDEQGHGFRLGFSESSRMTMKDLKQGKNQVEKLVLQFPQFLAIVNGSLLLSSHQGAGILLNNILLDNISVPEARLNNIAFTNFAQNKSPDRCTFKMLLTAPFIKIGEIRLVPLPMQLDGVCPEREEMKWWINAGAEKMAYEDEGYQLSLNRCQLKVGNIEQGRLLNEDPAELGGSFSCRSSRLSGELLTRFRFNPVTGVGRASYSIVDIKPDNENPLISSLLKDWREPFDILSGSLSVEGLYRWWKTRDGFDRDKLDIDFNVIDAGGYYEGLLFSDLNY